MSRLFLKFANAVVSTVIGLALLVTGLYAGYCLWDNNQIYNAAEDVQADMIKIKPIVMEELEDGPSFADLLELNPDVCAWVAMDNTRIDQPVVQGEHNLSYINTNIYGEYQLAGSIFLDSRNDRTFPEQDYMLTYGHDMENGGMYGDVALYKNEEFFDDNWNGTLIIPTGVYSLEAFACVVVDAADDLLFDPTFWNDRTRDEYKVYKENIWDLVDYACELSEQEGNKDNHVREETVEWMREMEWITGVRPQVFALSTCSFEFTNARTVLLTVMQPYEPFRQGGN